MMGAPSGHGSWAPVGLGASLWVFVWLGCMGLLMGLSRRLPSIMVPGANRRYANASSRDFGWG
ncbi:MAG: hypothetical protein CM1200mP20_01830 [Pseudomonadota bacterium]|nr:MAG: hypothetical protein CM1200mP20_01830 [Pseudomonadota bacterium]